MQKLIIFCLFTALSLPTHAMKVLIDPGHGGNDNGAVKNKIREANLTLKISKYLADLIKNDSTMSYTMSRLKDRSLELKERKEIAHDKSADIFVSVHANASLSPRVRGVELYFQNVLPPDENSNFLAARENDGENELRGHRPSIYKGKFGDKDLAHLLDDMARANYMKESYEFAKVLKSEWRKNMGSGRVKIRQAPFYVVSTVNMPSLLVEVGYVTNRNEAKRLRSKRYQKRIAKTIYKALKAYQPTIKRNKTK